MFMYISARIHYKISKFSLQGQMDGDGDDSQPPAA